MEDCYGEAVGCFGASGCVVGCVGFLAMASGMGGRSDDAYLAAGGHHHGIMLRRGCLEVELYMEYLICQKDDRSKQAACQYSCGDCREELCFEPTGRLVPEGLFVYGLFVTFYRYDRVMGFDLVRGEFDRLIGDELYEHGVGPVRNRMEINAGCRDRPVAVGEGVSCFRPRQVWRVRRCPRFDGNFHAAAVGSVEVADQVGQLFHVGVVFGDVLILSDVDNCLSGVSCFGFLEFADETHKGCNVWEPARLPENFGFGDIPFADCQDAVFLIAFLLEVIGFLPEPFYPRFLAEISAEMRAHESTPSSDENAAAGTCGDDTESE